MRTLLALVFALAMLGCGQTEFPGKCDYCKVDRPSISRYICDVCKGPHACCPADGMLIRSEHQRGWGPCTLKACPEK